MAGTSYTRQSTLTDGSLITAALFNDEYNQLLNAFVYSSTGTTGHTHDGSAGQGGAIAKIGDQDFKNKIEISSTNNRIECYIEVSGSPVEQLRIQDGAIVPVTDSDIDLGTTSLRFKDAFVDSLTVTGVVTATGFTIGSAVITEAELEILDGKTFLDEDDLVSDSATGIPSQQSVKAYVDAQVTAQDLDLTDGTTSISIDLDSEALSVLGGTGITSTASGNGVTLAIDSTVATLTGTQTLTNKTLTSPDVNGGTIDGAVIGGTAAAAGSFTTVDATGNITVGGTVDGRDVAADGTKLDGIETAATADQTASEIRALVEAATDSNVFTDADHGKLNGIEASATADQTDAEIRAAVEAATDSNVFTDADHSKLNAIEASADVTDTTNVTAAGALMDSEVTNLAQVKAFDSSDYATAAQGTTAEDALPKSGGAMTGAITTNSTFDGRDVATDGTKLDAIEASADVTDTANVTAAGALMDSELTAIASVKALNQGVATTDSPSFVNLTLSGTGSVKVPSGTTAQRDGSPVNGMFRYNSTNEQFEGYQSGDWGAIGGGGGSNTFTADTFTANGSTTAYALSQVINSENNLLVFIDGVFQQQSAYSIATASGTTTLTFSTAPANTREIIVYSVASAVSGSNLNTDSMTGDGSDVTLALSIAPVSENNTQVFIDGVYQNKDTYSISGTTLTFSTAPPTGSAVEVMTMTQTEVNVPVDGTITSAKLSGDLVTPSNLTVTGTATMDGLTVQTTNGLNALLESSNSYQYLQFKNTDETNNYIGFVSDDFVVSPANNQKLIVTAEGNVGIGASPVSYANYSTLAQSGTTGVTLEQRVGATLTGSLTTDSQVTLNAVTAIPLVFKTTNTERMRINSSGQVGIGTSSPSANITIDKGLGGSSHTTFTTANSYLQLGVSDYNSSGGVYAIGFGYTGGATHSPAYIGLQQTETGSYTKGDLVFRTRSTSTDVEPPERMRIDSSGNVGIGTSSVDTKLHLEESGAESLFLKTQNSAGALLVGNNSAGNSYVSAQTSGKPLIFETQNTERVRIDSSGNLLVGQTSVDITVNGVSLSGSGTSWFTATSDYPMGLNRKTSDGVILWVGKDGSNVGSIGVSGGDNLYISGSASNHAGLTFATDAILPTRQGAIIDNATDLGSSTERFDDIYATNGTIQTSDRNEKQDIAELSDAEQRVAVACKGLLRKFRWKDSVAEKGDDARIHFGIIAQDLQAAFAAEGLDAGDYAMFISTTWTDEETNEEKTRMGVRYSELLAFIIAAI